jgi:hypothetical protein
VSPWVRADAWWMAVVKLDCGLEVVVASHNYLVPPYYLVTLPVMTKFSLNAG